MVYTAEEDERRIREKYGDMLEEVEVNKEYIVHGKKKQKVYLGISVFFWYMCYLLTLAVYGNVFSGESKSPIFGMSIVLLLQFQRWRSYFIPKRRHLSTITILIFVYLWLCFIVFGEERLNNVFFGWFWGYGYALVGLPLFSYLLWRWYKDDRLALLCYLGGIGFVILHCLVPTRQRFLIFFCIVVAYLEMCYMRYRLNQGTYKEYRARCMDADTMILFMLIPLAIFYMIEEGLKLGQLPEVMALYLVISGIGSLEYILYILSDYDYHRHVEKGVK